MYVPPIICFPVPLFMCLCICTTWCLYSNITKFLGSSGSATDYYLVILGKVFLGDHRHEQYDVVAADILESAICSKLYVYFKFFETKVSCIKNCDIFKTFGKYVFV